MLKDQVGMRVGCLMLMIVGEIGEIRKFCKDRVTAEMIIGVITRMVIKKISGSTAGIDFRFNNQRFNNRGYQVRNGGKNDDFSRGNRRNRDSQIDIGVKTIEEGNIDIDLSKTGLKERQKQELRDLFNRFKGLFSDKPGFTHIFYHEIDTGDKTSVVSRPYRYDRVKQTIFDYHVDKMLKEGTKLPIQSPYASSVVLCRKNNGLPPDKPEAYRFAVDYRKLNAITKYP
ncbi:retrovirus-related Pol polyprotein from transposon 17.6 [Trichonephila clavipes]|nr:retrovirus-related Pol polyprotein from transposon 17.6 [Trichonephila clavipes]